MPLTPVYGLPFEAEDDQPLHSLTGGSSGTEPILAEEVEDQLVRIDGDVSDLQDAVAVGWTPIASGVEAGPFTMDLTPPQYPAGTFELIRVHMRGSMSEVTRIQARVNADTTAALHRMAYEVRRLDNSAIMAQNGDEVTSWPVAWWGTASNCTSFFTIYNTDENTLLSMTCESHRAAAAGDGRQRMVSNGSLASARLLSSLQMFPFTGSIGTCRWWAEGYRSA